MRIPLPGVSCALGAAIALALAPTAGRAQGAGADSAAIPASARQEIARLDAASLAAMKAGDAATVASLYADTAVFVTIGGRVYRGRRGVEEFMRARFRAGGRPASGTIVQDGLTRAGAMIYEWGHVELRMAEADPGAEPLRGRYLTVWAPEAAGRWRIVRNLSLP